MAKKINVTMCRSVQIVKVWSASVHRVQPKIYVRSCRP